jgi:hypothetical protein
MDRVSCLLVCLLKVLLDETNKACSRLVSSASEAMQREPVPQHIQLNGLQSYLEMRKKMKLNTQAREVQSSVHLVSCMP